MKELSGVSIALECSVSVKIACICSLLEWIGTWYPFYGIPVRVAYLSKARIMRQYEKNRVGFRLSQAKRVAFTNGLVF